MFTVNNVINNTEDEAPQSNKMLSSRFLILNLNHFTCSFDMSAKLATNSSFTNPKHAPAFESDSATNPPFESCLDTVHSFHRVDW